jgi:hypothetical protein
MRTLYAVFALTLWSASAPASTIQFVQDGWLTGATLKVTFTGSDTDEDGTIAQSELDLFNATWSGPSGVATKWMLSDIETDGFFFTDLGNYLFFTANPEFSLVSSAFEGEALASVFDQFLFPVDNSAASPQAVPEPSGMGVIGLMAVILGVLARKRTRDKLAACPAGNFRDTPRRS